jgi:aminomethyltransferase
MDIAGLAPGRQRYAFFTDDHGGLLDDLMVTRLHEGPGHGDLLLIVNAACKDADLAHLQRHFGARCAVQPLPDLALLALQGPQAVTALARLNPRVAALTFMTGGVFELLGVDCHLTRSGYTGEDGFEISVPANHAEVLARALLGQPEVAPAGLGARDTLRLEAGLCLYGHDIDTTTTAIEAGLGWAIQKVRRSGGARAGGYPGAEVIDAQLADGASRRRVGLVGLQLAPVREGAEIVDDTGAVIGRVTSGTVGPTAEKPIAMAYVAASNAALGTGLHALVRGRRLPMQVAPLPFVPHRYRR